MSLVYLKVKICSLAAEATIIRRMEHRYKPRWRSHQDPTFFGLRSHRVADVRTEQRAALLAYGFLRGRAYHAIESTCYEPPNWSRVIDLIRKYGALAMSKEALTLALKDWQAVPGLQKAA